MKRIIVLLILLLFVSGCSASKKDNPIENPLTENTEEAIEESETIDMTIAPI